MTPSKDDVIYTIIREPSVRPAEGEGYTLGTVYRNGVKFCFSCEDEDRFLEKGGVKVATRTAIPRGLYALQVSRSQRFGKDLPEVLGVPNYSGVRIHGGNRAEDSAGCPLFGQLRTRDGVSGCKETVQKVIASIRLAKAAGSCAWLEVK